MPQPLSSFSLVICKSFGVVMYVLKKRYGCGSGPYGEVWLAFHWNCYEGSSASRWNEVDVNTSKGGGHIDEHISDLAGDASSSNYDTDFPDNFFILKRILECVLTKKKKKDIVIFNHKKFPAGYC